MLIILRRFFFMPLRRFDAARLFFEGTVYGNNNVIQHVATPMMFFAADAFAATLMEI